MDIDNKISLNWLKNIRYINELIEILHGIPSAEAKIKRAIALIKEIEAFEKCWEFFGKLGYSQKTRRRIFAKCILKLEARINRMVL